MKLSQGSDYFKICPVIKLFCNFLEVKKTLNYNTISVRTVPAVLEHEAIAGLTASKPSGMRGRSSSTATEDGRELSLDSLMKSVSFSE